MLTSSPVAHRSAAAVSPPVAPRPIIDPRPPASAHRFSNPVVRELARRAGEPLSFASTW
jgi:hypothetical protein